MSSHRLLAAAIGAASALITMVSVAACADHTPATTAPSSAPVRPTEVTDDAAKETLAQHRRLALAASRRVVAATPLPPGSRRLHGKPPGWPDGGTAVGPSDARLGRTRWWSVPASTAAVADFLRAHAPADMRHPGSEDDISEGPGSMSTVEYDSRRASDPSAYTGPTLIVEFAPVGDRTVIHATTFLALREVVPAQARVMARVTSVRIERTAHRDRRGRPQHLAPVSLSSADPVEDNLIRRLVLAFDRLPGSVTPASLGWMSCPFIPSPVPRTRVTFTTDDGHATVATLTQGCESQVHVAVDGRRLEKTLDPMGWQKVVDSVAAFVVRRRCCTTPRG